MFCSGINFVAEFPSFRVADWKILTGCRGEDDGLTLLTPSWHPATAMTTLTPASPRVTNGFEFAGFHNNTILVLGDKESWSSWPRETGGERVTHDTAEMMLKMMISRWGWSPCPSPPSWPCRWSWCWPARSCAAATGPGCCSRSGCSGTSAGSAADPRPAMQQHLETKQQQQQQWEQDECSSLTIMVRCSGDHRRVCHEHRYSVTGPPGTGPVVTSGQCFQIIRHGQGDIFSPVRGTYCHQDLLTVGNYALSS